MSELSDTELDAIRAKVRECPNSMREAELLLAHADALQARVWEMQAVVSFVANTRLLFAYTINVEIGNYLRCLRCGGEGKILSMIAHDKGCPIQTAREIIAALANDAATGPETQG